MNDLKYLAAALLAACLLSAHADGMPDVPCTKPELPCRNDRDRPAKPTHAPHPDDVEAREVDEPGVLGLVAVGLLIAGASAAAARRLSRQSKESQ